MVIYNFVLQLYLILWYICSVCVLFSSTFTYMYCIVSTLILYGAMFNLGLLILYNGTCIMYDFVQLISNVKKNHIQLHNSMCVEDLDLEETVI